MKKFYWTKERKLQYKYCKIIFWVFMFATALIGRLGVVTTNYIEKFGIIPVVYAKQIPAEEIIENVETVRDQIKRIAEEENFKWIDYLLRLAKCENPNFDPLLDNTQGNNPKNSRDRGIFQINSYYHYEVKDSCAYDVECATKWTMERINAGYQSEWVCDKYVRSNPDKYR